MKERRKKKNFTPIRFYCIMIESQRRPFPFRAHCFVCNQLTFTNPTQKLQRRGKSNVIRCTYIEVTQSHFFRIFFSFLFPFSNYLSLSNVSEKLSITYNTANEKKKKKMVVNVRSKMPRFTRRPFPLADFAIKPTRMCV